MPVHDIGITDDDRPYYVMDYADAGSLEQFRKQPTSPGRALRLVAEAARGVEVLHRHNVIHRDITPGNILLQYSKQGVRVLLADLGVAKSLTDKQEGTMTAGTPAYMAYEQATGGHLDQRVDIYSLAAVAYALLAGRPPFPIKTLNDLLNRDWSIGVTPIASSVGAPAFLDQLMTAALSPNPQSRPQSAAELAQAFDTVADVLPGGDTYIPKPLESSSGSSWIDLGTDRPAAPPPVSPSDPSGHYSSGSYRSVWDYASDPSEVNQRSYHASLAPHNSVVPVDETPQSMLNKYLGEGTYRVAKPKEKHTQSYYLALAIGALLVFVLVLIITITFLT